jgi:hypothetical protein
MTLLGKFTFKNWTEFVERHPGCGPLKNYPHLIHEGTLSEYFERCKVAEAKLDEMCRLYTCKQDELQEVLARLLGVSKPPPPKAEGYRDDFYCAANIIGYTGDPEDFPTVYFRSGEYFGRITQEHGGRFRKEQGGRITQEQGYSQNVGRAAVQQAPDYTIGNEVVDGEVRSVERYVSPRYGEINHVSRGKFTSVAELQQQANWEQTFALLAQAIWRYPDERYISHFEPKDENRIEVSKTRMQLVLADVRRRGVQQAPKRVYKLQ